MRSRAEETAETIVLVIIGVALIWILICSTISMAKTSATAQRVKTIEKKVKEEPRVIEYHYYEKEQDKVGGE